MKFTNAAKVLGGEISALARPNLLNLGIAGAGAIVAGSSARNMHDRGLSVGNSLGAAAGTAAMVVGGHRLGFHTLATKAGQQGLAKGVIQSAARVGKADSSLMPLARGIGRVGKGINKLSGYGGSEAAQSRVAKALELSQSNGLKSKMFPAMNTGPVNLRLPKPPRAL